MASLADRRPKAGLHVETKASRHITKLEPPDTISNHYTFKASSGRLTRAAKVGNEENADMEFVARVVPKQKFAPVVDASVASEKLSEFDWLKTVESILNINVGGRNLITFHELLEDADTYYLIMESYRDADFMNDILYKKEIEEADAKRIVRQLLNGLNNLHSQGMVHRDVQPENIRFRGASFEKTELVLLPSEDVALHEPTSPKHKVVGEGEEKKVKIFHAPERLLGDFSASSDLWSVGVLMYILICGEPPFSEPCGDSRGNVRSSRIDEDRLRARSVVKKRQPPGVISVIPEYRICDVLTTGREGDDACPSDRADRRPGPDSCPAVRESIRPRCCGGRRRNKARPAGPGATERTGERNDPKTRLAIPICFSQISQIAFRFFSVLWFEKYISLGQRFWKFH
jgi:serine/threonine protein kinase